jgi:fructokinase
MSPPIAVVAGEALIDVVHHAGGAPTEHPGGGPFNAARAIARLEQPVGFLGRLSTDANGRRLRALLARDGVALDLAVPTRDRTTLAHAWLRGGVATYEFDAAGTSAPGLTLADARDRMPADAGALVVGTLGLVLEPIASTLEALVADAAERTLVVVDPNCRPAAIRDEAGYRARLDRILARTDVVKTSEEDLAWLAPGVPPEAAARGLLARGARVALVTLGAEGALVVTREGTVAVPAPPARVVDTIGAGDAFLGAFVAQWLHAGLERDRLARLEPVTDATRFACAVAARTVERAGADPPRRAELPSLRTPAAVPQR